MEIYINKKLSDVINIFTELNQPTSVFLYSSNKIKLIYDFGTNEGGSVYNIYVNEEGIIIDIKTIEIQLI